MSTYTYTSKAEWQAALAKRYPDATVTNTGSRIFAVNAGIDVGFWSIVGGFGKLY